ncbi:hypothetical protein EMCG_01738 [[Emmonsia] crescens]|uniref:Uncharacterized protein n=1 Tax=[Emmonsia] crescens TaxID=73230 RepID=A0A0G2J2C2_9EURO|nr:hypothetical protein EMCG_01738 [Emmonsia crescens UAMH 3008]
MFRSLIPKATGPPLLRSASQKYPFASSRRTFTSTPLSLNNTAPQSTTSAPSPHTSIYKSFGRAFAKVFLGGVLTYQIIYWAWVRLEVDEERVVRNSKL